MHNLLSRIERKARAVARRNVDLALVLGIARNLFVDSGSVRTFRVKGASMRMPVPIYVSAYREIFLQQVYHFSTDKPRPRILDLGANVGMASLYFKRLYPDASIVAIEADPAIFQILAENMQRNQLTDIELINQCAWIADGVVSFAPDGLDGGHVDVAANAPGHVTVPALDLKKWLVGKQFDLIKMDIEGAEREIIPACIDELATTPNLIIEYHSRCSDPQNLSQLLGLLESRRYRYHLESMQSVESPLSYNWQQSAYDNQINVYAWRI